MENEVFAGIVIVAISGLYWGIYKNHGCLKRIEGKVNTLGDIEYIKEELTDLKDSVRQLG